MVGGVFLNGLLACPLLEGRAALSPPPSLAGFRDDATRSVLLDEPFFPCSALISSPEFLPADLSSDASFRCAFSPAFGHDRVRFPRSLIVRGSPRHCPLEEGTFWTHGPF